jgi:hypothetical protein
MFAQGSNYRCNSFISKTKAGNERMTGLITVKAKEDIKVIPACIANKL